MDKQNYARGQDFIGLTKKRGQDLAETKNMIFQLVRIDLEPFLQYPESDFRDDRVYVEIDQGKISKATVT